MAADFTFDLSRGWSVAQDVHDCGEKLGVFKAGFSPLSIGPAFSEWEPIEELAHLQVIFARQPYFGRELRHYNEHPWWYRLEFSLPDGPLPKRARLRLGNVDFFCRVWLNGSLLGEHEGYAGGFEFEVTDLLRRDGPNLLALKVWSPWDHECRNDAWERRAYSIVRDMLKGTYEHADTFVQRDVNPVGMYGKPELLLYDDACIRGRVAIDCEVDKAATRAQVQISVPLHVETAATVSVRCRLRDPESGLVVAEQESRPHKASGDTTVSVAMDVAQPKLWWTWDQGQPQLYAADVEVIAGDGVAGGRVAAALSERFGIRTVELVRSERETTFVINGQKTYVRGATYFPEVYISRLSRERYYGDLLALQRSGCNLVRIHVHVEKQELYDLCDRLGIAVIQDSDFNWVHPQSEAWLARALRLFGEMVGELRNHPSIVAWVCMNEPASDVGNRNEYGKGSQLNRIPGPQLLAESIRLDPRRPAIRGSGAWDDLQSGDSHDYKGSLSGEATHYLDIYPQREKLVTEFGFDAPPCADHLRRVPEVYARLRPVVPAIADLQRYQYRLLKYYIEHYRITSPCSGYVQFMFRDLCPQSYYGVYDWWGTPKQGVRALEESNQPIGIFMEHHTEPVAVWVANDHRWGLGRCKAQWWVSDASGSKVAEGEREIDVGPDSSVRVSDLAFRIDKEKVYRVALSLVDAQGRVLASNVYEDAFDHPPHPQGHPARISHELGVRLYSA